MSTTDTAALPGAMLSRELVSQFFVEAAEAVGMMADATSRIVDCFRRNDAKAGNDLLATLPPELREFIVMVRVVDGSLGIDRAHLVVDSLAPDAQVARLGEWLESLVAAQVNDDPLTIADILEFDLEPFLRAWQTLLSQRAGALGRRRSAGPFIRSLAPAGRSARPVPRSVR